ncbi:hypothetical protein GCM10010211_83260 [Streptomyces albospinus]|uniref:Uncharacterized protein n=1 Tax=Streptomyces albospinus TaxID=285515 RepID=A0ABQ2VNU2_9ACTN|nr:hypothetical protein [Streptomyces albospinus]GGV03356.1 hypothetical protein GCM10010211_83260 [Streptomyces albospinus]
MPPEGYHVVRSHIRRNPRPRGKKMSGWMIAGLIAAIWLWGQVFGFGSEETTDHPASPRPAASTPASR